MGTVTFEDAIPTGVRLTADDWKFVDNFDPKQYAAQSQKVRQRLMGTPVPSEPKSQKQDSISPTISRETREIIDPPDSSYLATFTELVARVVGRHYGFKVGEIFNPRKRNGKLGNVRTMLYYLAHELSSPQLSLGDIAFQVCGREGGVASEAHRKVARSLERGDLRLRREVGTLKLLIQREVEKENLNVAP